MYIHLCTLSSNSKLPVTQLEKMAARSGSKNVLLNWQKSGSWWRAVYTHTLLYLPHIHIHVYMCMYVRIYTHTHIYSCICVCVHAHLLRKIIPYLCVGNPIGCSQLMKVSSSWLSQQVCAVCTNSLRTTRCTWTYVCFVCTHTV